MAHLLSEEVQGYGRQHILLSPISTQISQRQYVDAQRIIGDGTCDLLYTEPPAPEKLPASTTFGVLISPVYYSAAVDCHRSEAGVQRLQLTEALGLFGQCGRPSLWSDLWK